MYLLLNVVAVRQQGRDLQPLHVDHSGAILATQSATSCSPYCERERGRDVPAQRLDFPDLLSPGYVRRSTFLRGLTLGCCSDKSFLEPQPKASIP